MKPSKQIKWICILSLLGLASCDASGRCAGDDILAGVQAPVVCPPAMNAQKVGEDRVALGRLLEVPPGHRVDIEAVAPQAQDSMLSLGFVPEKGSAYRRAVAASPLGPGWVPMHSPQLPHVDTIAIISVAREEPHEPYIYATLRSLFATLPREAQVNVIVGDHNDAYLAPEVLAQQLGAQDAAHVHVWPAPQPWVDHLQEHLSLHARAGWNYSRALAGYRGSQGLMLLEDDVVWAPEALAALAKLLGPPSPPAISLYNFFCQLLPGGSPSTEGPSHILSIAARRLPWKFSRTQAMVYQAALVAPLAHYMQLRLQTMPLDLLVGEFMLEHDLVFGFAEPGMVQHIGCHTTGLGGFHTSRCFPQGAYPAPQGG